MAALRARRGGRGCGACGGPGMRLPIHDYGRGRRRKRAPAIATEPRPGRIGSRAGRTRHSERRSAVAAEPPPSLVFTAAVGAGHRRLLSCIAGAKPRTSRKLGSTAKKSSAEEGNRTLTPLRAQRPERCVSTSSTTSARCPEMVSAAPRSAHRLRLVQSPRGDLVISGGFRPDRRYRRCRSRRPEDD